jgi:hypothetical protein
MKKIASFLALSVIIIISVINISVFSAAATGTLIDSYKYYREIDTTSIREPVYVPLDVGILDYSESNGKDIRLFSADKFVPYYIEYTGSFAEVPVEDIIASLELPPFRGTTYSPKNMIDGSPVTYYQSFILDGKSTTLSIFFPDMYRLESISLDYIDSPAEKITAYAYIDGKATVVNTVTEETGTNQLKLNSVKTNRLDLQLEHAGGIKISAIKVMGETFGRIVFIPISNQTFLYYGKPNDPGEKYSTDNLYTTINTKTLGVSKQHVNLLFKGDKEGGLNDNCPTVDNPDQTDSDKDGVGDACDNCRFMQNRDQRDSDKDGVGDACDNCPSVQNPDQFDKDLKTKEGWVCEDTDKDGITNDLDNCIEGYNPDQQDIDRDNIGDACEDNDNDGIQNYKDLCLVVPDPSNLDTDKDGVGNVCDNCKTLYNPNQEDTNVDGIGDVCEDADKDGVFDSVDNCKRIANPDQIDWDKDNLGDKCDNCPEIRNFGQEDKDRDGTGDVCDKIESRALENPTIIWSIMILAAVMILGFAFFIKQKKSK